MGALPKAGGQMWADTPKRSGRIDPRLGEQCRPMFSQALGSAALMPLLPGQDEMFTTASINAEWLAAGVSLWMLLLADDMWVAADTRANLAANLNTFVRIGRAFGLEMHAAASPGAESKTLAMMVPAVDSRQEKDLQDIQLEDGRTVPFATVVKYLGTMISSDWTDTIAVKARMDKANGMFAMNKSWLCSKDASELAKARYYETCVLAALLYGAETWRLTKRLRSKLRTFHNMISPF